MRRESDRSWAEISLDALEHNLRCLRRLLAPGCKLMQVIKSNAYGHGIRQVGRCAEPYVDWFAVATVREAAILRNSGCTKPILVLGLLSDSEVLPAAELHLTADVCSLEDAARLSRIVLEHGQSLDCHIEIDTGINRAGIRAREGRYDEAVQEAEAVYRLPGLRFSGIFTHFACSGGNEDFRQFAALQWERFGKVCTLLEADGCPLGVRHCADSAITVSHPDYRLDMVRTGMLPLGQSDTEEQILQLDLQPILTWYARVLTIQNVPEGESIGYDRTYVAPRPMRLAIISAGYADGYSREYSNRSHLLIRGRPAPVCGKICMNCMMADVTDLPECRPGDPVVLLGRQQGAWVSANALSSLTPFGVSGAVTCAISSQVPRYYLRNGVLISDD